MRTLRDRKGQILIENLLMCVILVGIFVFFTNYAKENKLVSNLISGPWGKLAGMTESGVWAEPDEAKKKHPNSFQRFYTPDY